MSQYTPGPHAPGPYNPYQPPEVDAPILPEGPTEDPSAVPDHIVEHLRGTRPWVIFLAVVGFLGAGLMALVGFVFFVSMTATKIPGMPAGFGALIGLAYFVLGAVCGVPAIYMVRYTSAIGRLLRDPRMEQLGVALDAQRVYWKAVGIMCIVLIALYPLAIIVFAVVMVAAKS